MIVDLLLELVSVVLEGLAALIPEYELPYYDEISAWLVDISGAVKYVLTPIVPIDEYIDIVEDVLTVWIVGVIVFSVSLWFYRKIPAVGAS